MPWNSDWQAVCDVCGWKCKTPLFKKKAFKDSGVMVCGGGEVLVHAEDACDDGGKRSYTAPTQLVHIGGSQFSDRTLKASSLV